MTESRFDILRRVGQDTDRMKESLKEDLVNDYCGEFGLSDGSTLAVIDDMLYHFTADDEKHDIADYPLDEFWGVYLDFFNLAFVEDNE